MARAWFGAYVIADSSAAQPGMAMRLGGLAPFHDITVHGYFTYWYDARRRLTVIVYSCASAFSALGKVRDNFPVLGADLERMTRNVRVADRAAGSGSR